MRDLLHVTLQTGHERMSPRSEVGAGVTEALAPLLMRATRGERVGLEQVPGYTWTAEAHGRCLVATLSAMQTDGGHPLPAPVLTVGVAGHSRCGATLWRLLHPMGARYATDPEAQPPTPWMADRIEPGMARWPETAEWSGDWSRCIAWTWLELRESA